MGVYAAGAGAYNEQTAAARSMNANTAMQMNDYMYGITRRNAQNYSKRQQEKMKLNTETLATTYRRLHDNPSASDVRSGDALNVVLDELTSPNVYTQVAQRSSQPIDSRLVKNIEFEYAAQMIAISLDDLSSRGVPDVLLTNDEFQPDRAALRAIIEKARQEGSSPGSQVSPETLAKGRAAITALRNKVDRLLPVGTRDRDEADNFLKALYGLTKMLQSPDVALFLKDLDKIPTTTLGQLITFMHSFNLRFGVSKTPEQGEAYDQLYPLLVKLRNEAIPQGSNVVENAASMLDPRKVTSFFSGMHFNHFQNQPSPTPPPPPAPGFPK
jgi:hypothetical protein